MDEATKEQERAAPGSARIAQVIVDLDVPHLDRPFDYRIPDRLLGSVAIGSLVRVRWGGRRISGWVVDLSEDSEHPGKLSEILQVLSVIPLFTARMLATYRYIATRFAVNLSQVLSLAIPVRRKKTEEQFSAQEPAETWPALDGEAAENPDYPGVPIIKSADHANLPRYVVQAVPHRERTGLKNLLHQCFGAEIPVIITAPTYATAKSLHRYLGQEFPLHAIGFSASELPHTARYEVHLRTLRGDFAAVVGTRTALWAPFEKPALMVIWDDASDHYRERRSPQVDALDVAVARARFEDYGLLAAALSRSIKAQALAESGWATSIEPDRGRLRLQIPKIRLAHSGDFEREGMAALATLPNAAFDVVRAGLHSGAVLVQVAGGRHWRFTACPHCHARPACPKCGGLLQVAELPSGAPTQVGVCVTCNGEYPVDRCAYCRNGRIEIKEVGADRIARELGRALPHTSVVTSSAKTKILRRIRPGRKIVVATSGAEPHVSGGYAAVVITEASQLAYADRLGAEEEALRRWLNTFSLARPEAPAVLSGDVPARLGQALVLWRPVEFAAEKLEERREVGFYPARWVIAIDGKPEAVREMVRRLERTELAPAAPPLTTLGMTERPASANTEPSLRAALSCSPAQALSLMRTVKALQAERSLNREPRTKVVVDPPDLL